MSSQQQQQLAQNPYANLKTSAGKQPPFYEKATWRMGLGWGGGMAVGSVMGLLKGVRGSRDHASAAIRRNFIINEVSRVGVKYSNNVASAVMLFSMFEYTYARFLYAGNHDIRSQLAAAVTAAGLFGMPKGLGTALFYALISPAFYLPYKWFSGEYGREELREAWEIYR